MLLKGKRVIVTGGVTGIGKATVLACAREGAAVVSMSRALPSEDRAKKLVEEAKKLGAGPIEHMKVDIRKQDEVNIVFDKAVALMGGLDGLINCAGLEALKPAENLTAEDLYAMLDVHVLGTAFTNAAAFRDMKKTGGAIVNYTSYAGVCGLENMAAYGAAKGGMVGYSRVIAKEWAKYMIRVNIVSPIIMTELAQQWYDEKTPEERAQADAWIASSVLLGGKWGKVEDAANLNVFLVSDMSSFIHGQLISVDGGMLMTR